nr:arylamine N-acetyltransferase, pineal gland isozyme NAT-3-like [Pelodiscus sinensis]|eukprot:XP_006122741.1 arylamine N-acetyltransferase, pineal gland isozyme NAT-3-like [Pelodiscus sinensis]
MDIADYFTRISYNGAYKNLDLETLTAILQHHIRAVPFENLSIHCGETIELDLEPIYDKIVRKKRGGWCMENNHLLSWVLKTLGYDTTMLAAKVYIPEENAYSHYANHLLLKVVLDGKAYIVDGGFGMDYQMWQPMELISGKDQPQVPGIFHFMEDKGIWYFEKIKRKQYNPKQSRSNSDHLEKKARRKIYLFTLEPQEIENFRSLNVHLQTSPDSLFVIKSICSLQTPDGLWALVGWTLTKVKYNYKENMDLLETTTLTDEEVEKTLQDKFGIMLDRKLVPVNSSRLSLAYFIG